MEVALQPAECEQANLEQVEFVVAAQEWMEAEYAKGDVQNAIGKIKLCLLSL